MAVVDVAIAAGTALGVGGGGVAAGLVGGAAIGAGAGALYSGITGDGDILNSALTGALIGGSIGGIGGAFANPSTIGSLGSGGAFTPAAGSGASFATPTAAQLAAGAPTPAMASAVLNSSNPAALDAIAASHGVFAEGSSALPGAGLTQAPSVIGAQPVLTDAAAKTAATGLTGKEMLGYGLAGTAALSLLGQNKSKISPTTGTTPSYIRPYTYSQTPGVAPAGVTYGANGLPILPTNEQNYFNQSYTTGTPYKAAAGGVMSVPTPGLMDGGKSGNVDFMHGDMYPTSQQNTAHYAVPSQMPTSANQVMASYEPKTNPLTGEPMQLAVGGIADAYNLGSYSDGGRLLKGPGDGVSDDIPATIGHKQPARLADGEFVIPARIVSELGNGSTDAGAKRLYAMMDRIQSGRKKTIGKDKVAVNSKAEKHLPA